ncbi:MAG: hypothetical protein V1813_03970 [Candidatus Aenigmatarchaeota archaeon]
MGKVLVYVSYLLLRHELGVHGYVKEARAGYREPDEQGDAQGLRAHEPGRRRDKSHHGKEHDEIEAGGEGGNRRPLPGLHLHPGLFEVPSHRGEERRKHLAEAYDGP